MKIKNICFAVNTIDQAKKVIDVSKKHKFKPIFFIKYYLVQGFGVDWVNAFSTLLKANFSKNAFELYVDADKDYGLSIDLINNNIDYVKLKSNTVIIKKIAQISKKNKVLLNPPFHIVDLTNIKNISVKITNILLNGIKNEN